MEALDPAAPFKNETKVEAWLYTRCRNWEPVEATRAEIASMTGGAAVRLRQIDAVRGQPVAAFHMVATALLRRQAERDGITSPPLIAPASTSIFDQVPPQTLKVAFCTC